MKRITKTFAAFFATIICFGTMCCTTVAAANSELISVSITADKESYSQGDTLQFDVTVSNKNDYAIDELNLKASLSANFKITKNENLSMQVGANETKNYTISATPLVAAGTTDLTNSPETGDSAPVIFMIVLTIAILVAIKTKSGRKVCSFMIATVICTSLTLNNLSFVFVDAAKDTAIVKATADFNYNNKIEQITVTAEYETDDLIIIDTSAFNGPNEQGFYNTDQLVETLSGTLKNSSTISSLSYTVTDVKNNTVLSGELVVGSKWKAVNFGLVMGTNFITVTAVDKGGVKHEAKLSVINSLEENMNNTNVNIGDNDEDGICNYYEEILGTNSDTKDTDGDTLTDYEELCGSATDPTMVDTDNNSISDADDDTDKDNLNNKQEIALGTHCLTEDTDGDSLKDGDEVNIYGTDPLNADTDADSLSDNQEIQLGYDPNKADSDDNGINDSEEITEQTKTLVIDESAPKGITSVSVKLNSPGHIDNNVKIHNTYNLDMRNTEVAGLIGIPAEITSVAEFETAEITFAYDEKALGSTDENNLRMLWYDEKNDNYVPLEAVLDTEKNTITYTTTHFSTYLVVDKKIWVDAMRANINYRNSEDVKYYDMALVVDVSGSMKGDRIVKAKTALNAFIDSMLGSDRVGIIKFESYASKVSDLTSDYSSLKTSIESLYAGGGTYANAGLSQGIQMLAESGSTNIPIIVLVCDGDIYYSSSIVEEAKKNGITIFCINVVNGTSYVMKQIASETGGAYYYAATNDDIVNAITNLKGDTISSVDVTDKDGDGLYDVYEVNGMKLSNGKIVYSDKDLTSSILDGTSDADSMGGAPVTETITIDGETFTSVLWHAPVYNTLSSDYIYVDGRRNTDGSYITSKLDYIPYSHDFRYLKYERPVSTTYEGETREVLGDDGIHGSFIDKLPEKKWYDLLGYSTIASVTTILVALIDGQAAYCVYEYIMGNGGPYEGLVPGSTRDYIYATFSLDQALFQVNSANDKFEKNMEDAIEAAMSVLNEYNTEVYIALAPTKTWDGSYYNTCCPELSWDYAYQAIDTLMNLPAFGIYNCAGAGAVLHCTYDPEKEKYSLEFRYYLIDYYDFTLYDILNDMNMLGLSKSFELYGGTFGTASWSKDDSLRILWMF